MRKLDGLITCRSGKGGTSFEILLPARTDKVGAGVPARLTD
nr:hypothetical protein [Massilia sp. YMA4]